MSSSTGEGARPGLASDLPAIGRIVDIVSTEKAGQRGGPLFLIGEGRDIAHGLVRYLDEGHLIVGTYDDIVVGAAAFRRVDLADTTRVARIELLIVDPEMREVGVGEAMMNQLVDTARADGCQHLDSWALPGDRETKNFFESFGLKARLLVLSRPVDPE